MNIQIPYSWLKDYLNTKADAKTIAKYLTLCGPSVEKLTEQGTDYIFDIEITTNRVDTACVYGIAREAYAILNRFGIKSSLKPIIGDLDIPKGNDLGINIVNNFKLNKRILAIRIDNVQLAPSPSWIQDRLRKVGQRPLINAIDITNYVMWETGHPVHVFDFDKLSSKKLIVREAKKGEKITTLDGKTHTLTGGEIVYDNGNGEIIDLPGIMGTENTVVSDTTKNVLLWVESNDPIKIRKASMDLSIRSQAAIINEKDPDSQTAEIAIKKAYHYFQQITKPASTSSLFDINEEKPVNNTVTTDCDFINNYIGIRLTENEITNYLTLLGFTVTVHNNTITVVVPSYRSKDVTSPEDIVEEVARIYGYHNIPSLLMEGKLPVNPSNFNLTFENDLKNHIASLGGIEIYTLSLVSRDQAGSGALKIKNPPGADGEYLRTTLMPSLMNTAYANKSYINRFHFFEIANVFFAKKSNLPSEVLMLGGIFYGYSYREAKGITEQLLSHFNIEFDQKKSDSVNFEAGRSIEYYSKNNYLGQLGYAINSSYIYYEFNIKSLELSQKPKTFIPIPKYPAQIEDITLKLPQMTIVEDLIKTVYKVDKNIKNVLLKDIYEDNYTFTIHYQDPQKTLNDGEVKIIRDKLLENVKLRYGAIQNS